MNLRFLQEPELEFGNGGTHIDIRHGITRFGPLDRDEPSAPTQLKVGLVGTEQTITAMQRWFENCRDGIAAKESKLSNLFPPFPGFSESSPFRCSLVFHERWCSPVRQREIDAVLMHAEGDQAVREAVGVFLDHAETLVEKGGLDALIVAPPEDLLAAVDGEVIERADSQESGIDEGSDVTTEVHGVTLAFHDVLKGEGMKLGAPIQMVRPYTYADARNAKGSRRNSSKLIAKQDEATRAWNIHTALYYKGGGIPWRLLRSATDLSACFVGVSFYRSIQRDRLLTSVAQVFNERGEGVIVKGGQAQLDKDDRQPHLSEDDASLLLSNAVSVYRREHRTSPARLVVHKTSKITEAERKGFQAAADQHHIDVTDLIDVKRSFTRLFRNGTYPPLRGTFLTLQKSIGLLYLRGSVNFFETYPGMYVPRPVEFSVAFSETPLEELASEMLSLSKLNWNNTQFDGGEPITVRAARRVGDILKCVPDDGAIQPSFRFYM